MQLNTAGAQGRTVGLVVVFFLCVQAFCMRFVFYFSMLKVFDPGKSIYNQKVSLFSSYFSVSQQQVTETKRQLALLREVLLPIG